MNNDLFELQDSLIKTFVCTECSEQIAKYMQKMQLINLFCRYASVTIKNVAHGTILRQKTTIYNF
jgi:uncharacterized protein YlaI